MANNTVIETLIYSQGRYGTH